MVLFATHNRKDYPYRFYVGHSQREAVREYRERYGLKGKHNVIMCRSYGGMRIVKI